MTRPDDEVEGMLLAVELAGIPEPGRRRAVTERMLEVLRLRATGLSTMETAVRLGVSDQSVKNLSGEAFRRLEVDNIVEAFVALGWLNPDPEARELRIRELERDLESLVDRASVLLERLRAGRVG
jgi:DNA-binding CsgD family transcriptional regulator